MTSAQGSVLNLGLLEDYKKYFMLIMAAASMLLLSNLIVNFYLLCMLNRKMRLVLEAYSCLKEGELQFETKKLEATIGFLM